MIINPALALGVIRGPLRCKHACKEVYDTARSLLSYLQAQGIEKGFINLPHDQVEQYVFLQLISIKKYEVLRDELKQDVTNEELLRILDFPPDDAGDEDVEKHSKQHRDPAWDAYFVTIDTFFEQNITKRTTA